MRRSKWLLMKVGATVALFAGLALPAGLDASTASAATPVQLSLKVLLIGNPVSSPADPTTTAWESALNAEGVPYTEVDATGAAGAETVTLPTLSDRYGRQLQRRHLRGITSELCCGTVDVVVHLRVNLRRATD